MLATHNEARRVIGRPRMTERRTWLGFSIICHCCGYSVCRRMRRMSFPLTPSFRCPRLVDRNRELHARSPVRVLVMHRSPHVSMPIVRVTAARFPYASGLVCHGHVAHNTTPVPLMFCRGLAETSCTSTSGARMRIAWKETHNPSVLVPQRFFRISEARRLIGTSLRPSEVLLSGTNIV